MLELKLETEDYNYWLLTYCVGEPFTGWREGVVLMENVQPDEEGMQSMMPYGEKELKTLQRLDYFHMIEEDLKRLLDEDEREPSSSEREKRIEELRKEITNLVPRLDDMFK